jgi:hypothetical protein
VKTTPTKPVHLCLLANKKYQVSVSTLVQSTIEVRLTGIGSPVCFILASFEYPSAIKTTWGRTADEIDDFTWGLLNGPGDGQGDKRLSLLLKMARLPDLGLGQLCLPDIDFDAELEDGSTYHRLNYQREKFSC